MRSLTALSRLAPAAALVLVAVTAVPAAAEAGDVVLAPRLAPNLAITSPPSAGQPVALAANTGSAAQVWNVPPDGKFGPVVNRQTGLCLDVAGGSTDPGATVIAGTCNGAKSQQWAGAQQDNLLATYKYYNNDGRLKLVLAASVGSPGVVISRSIADLTQEWLVQSAGLVGAPPPPPPTKEQCEHGGYAAFGFENQGQCVAFVERH